MERNVAENIRKAAFLRKQLKCAGNDHGCFDVALQALGGNVHPQEVIYSYNGRIDLQQSLERRGLTFDWVIKTDQMIDAEDLNQVLEYRHPEKEADGKFMGHFCGITPIQNGSSRGHGFAILPRDHMPRDFREILKTDGLHIVVDSLANSSVAVIDKVDLVDYINGYYEPPRNVIFARIRKFRDIQA